MKKRVAALGKDLKKRFEKIYSLWKADWQHPMILLSSNPVHRTYSPWYLELTSIGKEILPLLMEKLLQGDDNFFALQAVDLLSPAPLVVTYEFEDEAMLCGEQGRALETVRRWIMYLA